MITNTLRPDNAEPLILVVCDAKLKRPYGMFVQMAQFVPPEYEYFQATLAVEMINLFDKATILNQAPGDDARVVEGTRADWALLADKLRRSL